MGNMFKIFSAVMVLLIAVAPNANADDDYVDYYYINSQKQLIEIDSLEAASGYEDSVNYYSPTDYTVHLEDEGGYYDSGDDVYRPDLEPAHVTMPRGEY